MKQKPKNFLKALRKTAGVSLLEFSVTSGVSLSTLTAVERFGYYPKRPETREKIAKTLNVSEHEIWKESKDD